MCNERTERENQTYLKKQKQASLNRRNFTVLAGASLIGGCTKENRSLVAGSSPKTEMTAPQTALRSQTLNITTPDGPDGQDGQADCYFTHPQTGQYPAVIIWPDVMGLRATFREMADRLAGFGFAVLVINPYYRAVKGEVFRDGDRFSDPDVRARILPYARALSAQTVQTDARAMVDFLDAQNNVDTSKKIGTLGYCMGGSMTIRTAAHIPDRIGAAASFHGGRLVTDQANSPHHLIKQAKAGFLIAIADNDDEAAPDVKNVLRTTFDREKIKAKVEVYDGAMHGWCVPASPVYHEAQAEQAWQDMLSLLHENLV